MVKYLLPLLFVVILLLTITTIRTTTSFVWTKNYSCQKHYFVTNNIRGGGGGSEGSIHHSLSSSSSDKVSESERRTGWMHNQPKKEKQKQEAVEPAVEEYRTGWLHNKQSPSNKVVEKEAQVETTTTESESKAQRLLRLAKKKEMINHRILSSPTFHSCGDGRQAVITEHSIQVPLNHNNSNSGKVVTVYFTVVEEISSEIDVRFFSSLRFDDENETNVERRRADRYVEYGNRIDANDMILYLQGGPGFGAPAPICGIGLSDGSSWVGSALKDFKRVVLMDQRGTGRSTPITKQTLEVQFPNLFALDDTPTFGRLAEEQESILDKNDLVAKAIEEATEYMTHFRADSIVQDAELIKEALLIPPSDNDIHNPRPWGAALGQSFGGFCLMTYLSKVPNPPKICLFTGGIAPMLTPVDDVYQSLWKRVKKRNQLYYERYPGDVSLVKSIIQQLMMTTTPTKLPSGGILTPRRFLQLGIALGSSPSSFASLHSFLNSAFLSNTKTFTRSFLKQFDTKQSWDDCPIYFLLHESIYANGKQQHSNPTQWSAQRVLNQQPNGFDYENTSSQTTSPTMFYGEMVFPWMADGDYAELSGFGMRALAQSLAEKDNWGELYDADQMEKALDDNNTRAAAAVYYDDMYVDFNYSMKVIEEGPLKKCKVWVTNDYQHSGLRDDGATIFKKLLGMAKGSVGTPS